MIPEFASNHPQSVSEEDVLKGFMLNLTDIFDE